MSRFFSQQPKQTKQSSKPTNHAFLKSDFPDLIEDKTQTNDSSSELCSAISEQRLEL